MNHPMAQQAAQSFSDNFGNPAGTLPPAAAPAPITTPTTMVGQGPVGLPDTVPAGQVPIAPQAPMGNQGPGPAPRPDSINQIMQQQAEQTNPQNLGEQLRMQRLEQQLAEGTNRTQELQQQLVAQQTQMQQSQQSATNFQEQQLELQREQLEFQQQQAQQAQQQQQLPAEQRYAWTEQEQQTFGDARSVIEKTAAQIAEQMQSQQQQDPRVAELEQQLTQLRGQVDRFGQQTQQNFESQIQQAAQTHGLNVHALAQDPSWLAMMNETQQTIPGSTVGSTFSQVVTTALNGSRTVAEVNTLDHVFKAYAERQAGTAQQPLGHVPAGTAQARNTGTPPPANTQAVQAELQQLTAREETLRDQLRRASSRGGTRLNPEEFQKEMLAIEQRRTVLGTQINTG